MFTQRCSDTDDFIPSSFANSYFQLVLIYYFEKKYYVTSSVGVKILRTVYVNKKTVFAKLIDI